MYLDVDETSQKRQNISYDVSVKIKQNKDIRLFSLFVFSVQMFS